MTIVLWLLRIVLALLYVAAGGWKLVGPGPALETAMPGFSLGLIRLVGVFEVAMALGLVLPALARSWTAVAVWAGGLLALEAVAFVVYHLLHRAAAPAVATLILGAVAAFVAWRLGRARPAGTSRLPGRRASLTRPG
jgi:hypothetical protein